MKTFKSLFVGVVVASSVVLGQGMAHASTFTWDFAPGQKSVTFGNTKTFADAQNKYNITARGYKLPSGKTSPAPKNGAEWTTTYTANNNLYGKYTSGDLEETGLGLTGSGDGEINKNTFIQLDLTALPKDTEYIDLVISSIQKGETATIWGSNTVGKPGSLLAELTGNLGTIQTYRYNLSKGSYLSVSADPNGSGSNDILIQSRFTIKTPSRKVPESSSLVGILAVSTYGVSSVLSRKLRKK